MSANFNDVELGFVVSLGTLRDVLKDLNVAGRHWWLSSDPQDAAETGHITIADGTKRAYDRLNTLHFRVPVIWNDHASGKTDRRILILEASAVTEEEPDYDDDEVQDLYSFMLPIQEALIARLQASV